MSDGGPVDLRYGDMWWRDMEMVVPLDRQIGHGEPAGNSNDENVAGWKPRPPADPWWVTLVAVLVGLVGVAIALGTIVAAVRLS